MNQPDFHNLFADLLKRLDHPEIADVEPGALAVGVKFTDGANVFAKVAHIQAPSKAVPSVPSWPGFDPAQVRR